MASWYQNIDSKGKMVNEVVIPATNMELGRKLASNCPFMNSAMMFKIEPTREVGGYDESFQYSQDLALWLGLASLGEFRSIPEFLTSIRLSPTSLTNVAHFGMARTHDAYVLYRRAQKLDGLRPVDRLRGMRTIGLYGLLYSWRSLREGSVVRAVGLLIANFWAIPLALFDGIWALPLSKLGPRQPGVVASRSDAGGPRTCALSPLARCCGGHHYHEYHEYPHYLPYIYYLYYLHYMRVHQSASS
ncbi:MAG: hypothetical protein ACKPAJ_00795, partial [Actinomycetota bacterium]